MTPLNDSCFGTIHFSEGLTVSELKSLLQNWPEKNELGEPTEV